VTKGVTYSVTKGVTYAPVPIQEPPSRQLGLGSELRPPVPECLQRDALRFAIRPLIQAATLPRLMVCPPERLALARLSCPIACHPVLLSPQVREGEQIVPGPLRKSV